MNSKTQISHSIPKNSCNSCNSCKRITIMSQRSISLASGIIYQASLSIYHLEDELSDAVASGTLEPSPEVQVPPVASFLPPVIDDSEILEHKRTPFVETSKFKFGFALWCMEAGISVRHYSTILELLNMARDNMPEELAKLPSSLSTLKRWFRGVTVAKTIKKGVRKGYNIVLNNITDS